MLRLAIAEVVAIVPLRFGGIEILDFRRLKGEPQQLKSWREVFETPTKRYLHRAGILAAVGSTAILDLIRSDPLAIDLLKKRAMHQRTRRTRREKGRRAKSLESGRISRTS